MASEISISPRLNLGRRGFIIPKPHIVILVISYKTLVSHFNPFSILCDISTNNNIKCDISKVSCCDI